MSRSNSVGGWGRPVVFVLRGTAPVVSFEQSRNGIPMSDPLTIVDECLQYPPLMVEGELISYLRLDADNRNSRDRVRNLIRRQGLPVIRRGRLQLFRKTAIDTWLDGASLVIMEGCRRGLRRGVKP